MFNTHDWVCSLMAIDPGSSHLGIAIIDVKLNTSEIIRTQAFTINALDSRYYSKTNSQYFGDKFARFQAMKSELQYLFQSVNPSMVVCESPFFNRFTPNAYAVLTELVSIIHTSLWEYNNQVPFFKIDPPTAKKALGAKGNAKKEDMVVALSRFKDQLKLIQPVLTLDEHAVDACAIGYAGYLRYVLEHES